MRPPGRRRRQWKQRGVHRAAAAGPAPLAAGRNLPGPRCRRCRSHPSAARVSGPVPAAAAATRIAPAVAGTTRPRRTARRGRHCGRHPRRPLTQTPALAGAALSRAPVSARAGAGSRAVLPARAPHVRLRLQQPAASPPPPPHSHHRCWWCAAATSSTPAELVLAPPLPTRTRSRRRQAIGEGAPTAGRTQGPTGRTRRAAGHGGSGCGRRGTR